MEPETLLLASDGSPGALEAADWVQTHWSTANHRVVVVVVATGSTGETVGGHNMQPMLGLAVNSNLSMQPTMANVSIGGMWMTVPEPTQDTQDTYPSHLIQAHAQLQATMARLHGFAEIQGRVQTGQGQVVNGILAAMEEITPTLVVVGRRGLNRLERWVLGSVSQAMLNQSTVPVLVIPTDTPPP
jgi:nucleotide-binding universal stress UspA family protein